MFQICRFTLSMKYGYAFISAADQNAGMQLKALQKAGCHKLFTGHEGAGGTSKRSELLRCLRALQPGDTLVVCKLDRLARSLHALIEIVDGLGKRRANLLSLMDAINTSKQGLTGLGMDAQRQAVASFMNGNGQLAGEFTEVESGRKENRPELQKAIAACRQHRAVLLIAKLDRLARNVYFIAGLMNSDVEFVAYDMPSANRLTVHIWRRLPNMSVR